MVAGGTGVVPPLGDAAAAGGEQRRQGERECGERGGLRAAKWHGAADSLAEERKDGHRRVAGQAAQARGFTHRAREASIDVAKCHGVAQTPSRAACAIEPRGRRRDDRARCPAERSHVRSATLRAAADPRPPAASRPGDAFVQSFARGLAVLRSFGADAPAQTLTGAAERSGLTRAGARRILLTLQQLGYVESEGRLFRLTPRVMELGFAYLSSQPVWHLAQPVMEELVQDIHESSSAAVLDGDDIVYVLRVPAKKIMAISLGPGSRLPAYCTAMGRVLLAGLPETRAARASRARAAARRAPRAR